MTGCWCLPMQAELDGAAYAIRTDYRDILELLRWLGGTADPQLEQSGRWYVAMRDDRYIRRTNCTSLSYQEINE